MRRPSLRLAGRARLLLLFILAATLSLGSGRLTYAGFAEGLAAFDAGDLRGAYEEWMPLARAGDSQAQVAIAGILESGGAGLARNLAAAVRWYRRAASGGNAVAQMNLADFYARGVVVPQDMIRAVAWFSLAAEQGRSWAAKRHESLIAKMAPSEREAAELLAVRIRTKYGIGAH